MAKKTKPKNDMDIARAFTVNALKEYNQVTPTFLLFDGKNKNPILFMVPWSNDDEKYKFTQDIGPVLMAHFKTKKFIFIAESFISKFDKDKPEIPVTKLDAVVVIQVSAKQVTLLNMIVKKDKKDKWKIVEEYRSRTKPENSGAIPDILLRAIKMRELFTEEEIKTKFHAVSEMLKNCADYKHQN